MVSSSVCAPRVAATSSDEEEPTDASASPPRPARRSERFRPADRILRSTDFERIYRKGRRQTGPSFALFGMRNELGRSRLGITVTRKFGGAVLRNRSKRIVREIFRRNRDAFGASCDFVVNVRTGALTRPYTQLEQELMGLASRLVRIAR